MATIRRTTRIGGVLANVTSLVLCDPTGAYGIKRNDTDAVVVAADTAMTNVSVGTYEYTFTDVAGVSYTVWLKRVYGGQTKYAEIIFTATAAPITPDLSDARAAQEQADLDCLMADYGQAVTVYTSPTDSTGRSCTGIVVYNDAKVVRTPRVMEPRVMEPSIAVKLANSSTLGIAGTEWNEDFEVLVAPRPGATATRKRTTRMLAAGRFGTWITWELG